MGKLFSYILVLIQFFLITIIILSTSIRGFSFLSILFISIGIALGFWTIVYMRESKLHITPHVDKKAILITNGPYKYIRHPMYSAVLITSFGLLLTNFILLRIIFFLLLSVELIIKLHYEENLLQEHFKDYRKYKKTTLNLIPYLF